MDATVALGTGAVPAHQGGRSLLPLHDPDVSLRTRRTVLDRPVVGADREHVAGRGPG